MWLESRLQLLQNHDGPLLLVCEQSYGTNPLLQAFGVEELPLIWFELSPQDQDDEIAQGNCLADALRAQFGSALMTHSLPYAYGLNQLRIQLPYLDKFAYVMSNAHLSPRFAEGFFELHKHGNRVIMQLDELPVSMNYPENTLIIGADELRLTETEAFEFAKGQLRTQLTQQLFEETQGKHDTFLAELNLKVGRPPQLVPGPVGLRYPLGYEPEVDPKELLEVLLTSKRWLESLELVCDMLPERVPDVLKQAGHVYHERGMHKQLWVLLEPLPPHIKNNETVLFWLLSAAFRVDTVREVRSQVESYLETHEAPNLRALYAGVLPLQSQAFENTKRAYLAEKNAFTTFQMGVRAKSAEEGIRLLEESVGLAEQRGQNYEKVRNAAYLGERLLLQGNYSGAASWLTWALREFENHQLADVPRRLHIINNWAYVRLLSGETSGLESLLREGEQSLKEVYPELAQRFQATLGDFLLSTDRPEDALRYYKTNFTSTKRNYVGSAALDLVRALTQLGELEEAQIIANQAEQLTSIDIPFLQATALLAQGIALTFEKPRLALPKLEKALTSLSDPVDAPNIARTSLYLSKSNFLLGNRKEAHTYIETAKSYLSPLSETGLRMLSGSEKDFREVWDLVKKNQNDLEIRLLGTPEVWLNNQLVQLSPQALDILAILAIKKRPLAIEELLSFLFGDFGSKTNLKSSVYKLRQKVPISPHPYTISVPYQLDTELVQTLLDKGQIDEAIRYYRGPMLTSSDSPFLRDYDQTIREKLRTAALASREADTILKLSETEELADDLELLEQALAVIEQGDPRAQSIQARVHQIQSSWIN